MKIIHKNQIIFLIVITICVSSLNIGIRPDEVMASPEVGAKTFIENFTDDVLRKIVKKTFNDIYSFESKKINWENNSNTINPELTTVLNSTGENDKIQSLNGIEQLTKLEYIELKNHLINDIAPLSNLNNILSLNLSRNIITDISQLENFSSSLHTLNLSYNNIKDISPISNLYTINQLNLDNNLISHVASLNTLISLTKLSLSYNNIQNISVLANLKNIECLDLTGNRIHDFTPITKLPNLFELITNYNLNSNNKFIANLQTSASGLILGFDASKGIVPVPENTSSIILSSELKKDYDLSIYGHKNCTFVLPILNSHESSFSVSVENLPNYIHGSQFTDIGSLPSPYIMGNQIICEKISPSDTQLFFAMNKDDISNIYQIKRTNLYSISYNGNGASGHPPIYPQKYSKNTLAEILSSESLQKNGSSFGGWLNEADGVIYQPGGFITINESNIILKAVWKEVDTKTFSITYATNGGVGEILVDNNSYESGKKVMIKTQNNLQKYGFSFGGWLNEADGVIYQSEEFITINESNIILKAVWKEFPSASRNYKIIYLPLGAERGKIPIDTNSYKSGETAIILDARTLAKPGYIFHKWYDKNTNTYYPLNGLVTITNQDIILSPYWIKYTPSQKSFKNNFQSSSKNSIKDDGAYNSEEIIVYENPTPIPDNIDKPSTNKILIAENKQLNIVQLDITQYTSDNIIHVNSEIGADNLNLKLSALDVLNYQSKPKNIPGYASEIKIEFDNISLKVPINTIFDGLNNKLETLGANRDVDKKQLSKNMKINISLELLKDQTKMNKLGINNIEKYVTRATRTSHMYAFKISLINEYGQVVSSNIFDEPLPHRIENYIKILIKTDSPSTCVLSTMNGESWVPIPTLFANNLQILASTPNLQYFTSVNIKSKYNDISEHWGKKYIIKSSGNYISRGFGDGTFRPNQMVTRAEFTTMIVRSMGYSQTNGTKSPFKDVSHENWYYEPISIAKQNGWLNFVAENENFAPNKPITREEMSSIISTIYDKDMEKISLNTIFVDYDKINQTFMDDIEKVVGLNIMHGNGDKTFDPKGFATRAQVAVVLENLISAYDILKTSK